MSKISESNEIENDIMDEFEDFQDDEEMVMLTSILKSASKSADNLTSLIVENNNRNNIAMSNEDIYDIYRNSFIVSLTTIAPSQSE